MKEEKRKAIRFSKAELNWIERTADIETARLFANFNNILSIYKSAPEKSKNFLDNQIKELIDLYTFLRTLRSKLELWDTRYDIESVIVDLTKEDAQKSSKEGK